MARRYCALLALVAIISTLIWTPVRAQDRPIQLALVTPIQIYPEDDSITGLRLNLLYGRNASVTGLDLGLVNHTTGMTYGVQWGMVSLCDSDFMGWQNCSVNVTKGKAEGLQWGIVNYAGVASGVQFGFVNYAESMRGLQVGLVNVIRQGGAFPVFPIVNWSF